MKCAFCKTTEADIEKAGGKLIVMKNKPEVSICKDCLTLCKIGKMDHADVNQKPKTILFIGDENETQQD